MTATGRVALVTGGARRVGRAIVQRLADAGFGVAFTYCHSADAAAELADRLGAGGTDVLVIHADLTDPAPAAEAVADAVRRRFDRLDLLVNNASHYERNTLDTIDLAQLRRATAVHVEGPMLLCQRLAPLLRQSRGCIVNITDVLVERPWPDYLGYCLTKAALANLTLGLARELAPEVRVNAIAPAVVDWPESADDAYRQRYLQRMPLGRPGEPIDVAEAVYFLCTAGRYITGQSLRLDGGYSIT